MPDCNTVTPDFANVFNHGIDIADFKKNVVNTAAGLVEKILICVLTLEGLDQFDFDVS